MSFNPTSISTVTQLHLNSAPTASEQSASQHVNSEPYQHLNSSLTASQQSRTVQMQLKGRYKARFISLDISLSGESLQLALLAETAASCAALRREEECAGLIVVEAEAKTETEQYGDTHEN